MPLPLASDVYVALAVLVVALAWLEAPALYSLPTPARAVPPLPSPLLLGTAAVHVVLAVLYAVVLWLAAVAYVAVVGGSVLWLVLLAPVVISGVAAVAMVLGVLFEVARVTCGRFLWRCRGTWRS